MPAVSVLMPVFNEERYVARSITSVLTQSFRDFELIVVDNASTDGTPGLCRHFARIDKRIRLVENEQNVGAYDNHFDIYRRAESDLVCLIGGHDLMGPDYLQRSVNIFREHTRPLAMAMTAAVAINDAGDPLGGVPIRTDLRMLTPIQRVLAYLAGWSWPAATAMFGVCRRDWVTDSIDRLRALEGGGRFLFWDVLVVLDLAARGELAVDPHVELYVRLLNKMDGDARPGHHVRWMPADEVQRLVLGAATALMEQRFAIERDRALVLDVLRDIVDLALTISEQPPEPTPAPDTGPHA